MSSDQRRSNPDDAMPEIGIMKIEPIEVGYPDPSEGGF